MVMGGDSCSEAYLMDIFSHLFVVNIVIRYCFEKTERKKKEAGDCRFF